MPARTRSLRLGPGEAKEEARENKQQPRPPVPPPEAASSTIRIPDRMPRSPASRFRNEDTPRNLAPKSLDRSLNYPLNYSPNYLAECLLN
jgi:hypothetical protein